MSFVNPADDSVAVSTEMEGDAYLVACPRGLFVTRHHRGLPPLYGSVGPEFPGAAGTIARNTEHMMAGAGCLSINADFEGGGGYIAANQSFRVTSPTGLRFQLHSTDIKAIGYRALDSSGQWHQRFIPVVEQPDWQELTVVELASPEGHWGGANDGVFHGSLTQLSVIGARNQLLPDSLKASVLIDELQITHALTDDAGER